MGLIDTMLRGDGGMPGETRAVDVPIARRGTTQTGVRLYNERLVLSLIRARGSLPKAEVARLTGLSPQTVSVIVRQLEADLLVVKGRSVRGKVGQPSQPHSLNPDGAFSIGLKVGRRSGDLALIDLDGKVRDRVHLPYRFPTPTEFVRFARDGLNTLIERLGPLFARRICGLGIAMPFDIWKWEEESGAPRDVRESWHGFDLPTAIGALCDWPVIACNDATAACSAELFFGGGRQHRDYGYLYVGYFAGGGLVINGHVHQGPTGNAGAFGSIPVVRPSGGNEQLIRSASLYLLEKQLRDLGHSPDLLWDSADDWADIQPLVDRWIEPAARGLAMAATSIAAIIDCPVVIIDGAMPPGVRQRLVDEVRRCLARINLDGISPFAVAEGTLGIDARALGAASLPLFANYMTDRDVLFKETV
jgi:predicted NBD/HSP70 family sugar kinase